MIAGAGKPDDIDRFLFAHLDRWIAVRWHDGPVRPPMDVPFGTHVATFVHCRPGGEIRGLNLCWLVESAPGEFYRVGTLLEGIQATWLFRYETLRKFELAPIQLFQVEALGLPDLDLGDAASADLREFRLRRDLDSYRHPGYPDDLSSEYVSRALPESGAARGRERLWVRVKRVVSPSVFESELLNTPERLVGQAGQVVTTYIKGVGDDQEIWSSPDDATDSQAIGAALEADKVIPLVPCLTIGCEGAPLNITPSAARAYIEHHLRDDPTFRFVVTCDRCGVESRYSLDAIIAMIPVSRRPRSLAPDELMVVLLAELNVAPEMDRSFFGERLLARRLTTVANDGGLAELLVSSAIARTVRRGDVVRVVPWDDLPIVRSVIKAGVETAIDIDIGPRTNAVGLYVSPTSDPAQLRAANVPCSNPSCCMVFSLTYSEYQRRIEELDASAPVQRFASALVSATCLTCGTSRVIDERSFDGLARI